MKTKVLVISAKDFLTFKGGDATLTNLLVKDLQRGFDVYTVSLGDKNLVEGKNYKILKTRINYFKIFVELFRGKHPFFSRFFNSKIVECIQELKPEIVICEHLYMTPMAIAAENRRDFILVSNIHILESRIQSGLSKFLLPLLKRNELESLKASNYNWSFDQEEVDHLKKYRDIASKTRKVSPSLTNGLKTDLRGDIIFIGNQFWKPNRLAVENIFDIWPRITARFPTASLRIVGDYDKKWYINIPGGISLEGRIDDVDEILNHARLLIAPITIGGGVRVKILECVARGIPILSTKLGSGDLKTNFPSIISCQNIEVLEAELAKILNGNYDLESISISLYESNAIFHAQSSFSTILLELVKK